MSIHPLVIVTTVIAAFAFLAITTVCAAWVAIAWINAQAARRAELEYRIERERQQVIEAARYQVLAAQSRAIAEAPRAR